MHGYITPEVVTLVDEEVERGVKVAKRVHEFLDKDRLEVVQDINVFWFETVYLDAYIPEYVRKYLKRLIEKKLGLKYWE